MPVTEARVTGNVTVKEIGKDNCDSKQIGLTKFNHVLICGFPLYNDNRYLLCLS